MPATAYFKITVCGIEELTEYCKAQVSHVISILDPAWPVPPALYTYREHERLELRFDDVIERVPDKVPPGPQHIQQLLALGRRLMGEPAATRHLLIHCGAGFSRSPAAVALLLAQAVPALAPGDIAAEVLRLRPTAWPNLRSSSWATACWIGAESWSGPRQGYTGIVLRTNQSSPNS